MQLSLRFPDGTPHRYFLCFLDIPNPTYNESGRSPISRKEVTSMWVKPNFKIIETCAEVTAYAYRK